MATSQGGKRLQVMHESADMHDGFCMMRSHPRTGANTRRLGAGRISCLVSSTASRSLRPLGSNSVAGLKKCCGNPWHSDFPGKKAQEIKQLTAEARLVLMFGVSIIMSKRVL